MIKLKLTMMVAILMFLSTHSIMAQTNNPSGPYLGAGLGQFNLNIRDLSDAETAVNSISRSNNNSQKFFAGYRFNSYWALEAAYIDLGRCRDRFTATGSNGDYRVDISGFSPALLFSVPIGPFELFGKVGQYYYDSKLKVDFSDSSPSIESTHRRNDLLYGGGVGLTFFERLHVRAEYETIQIRTAKHSDAVWLSAAWRF